MIMPILPLAIMFILLLAGAIIKEQDKHDRKRQDQHDKPDDKISAALDIWEPSLK
jgi:hypothetical protein